MKNSSSLSHAESSPYHQAEHLALYQQVLDRLHLSTQQYHARLHQTLLAFEQKRLTQKSYHQYGNIYRLIEQLKHLGQEGEIRAFQQYVMTHCANRKKLVDWLNAFH